MAGNDLLTRNIKDVFGDDWVYLLNALGTVEGRATIDSILALSDKEINTISNTGTGAQLAKAKNGVDFPIRTLVSEDGTVQIAQNTDDINLKAVRVGVYREVWVSAGAIIGQDTNGATPGTSEGTTNGTMNDFYDFATGVDSYVQFSFKLPAEWDAGGNPGAVKLRVYWTSGTTLGSGDVSFEFSSKEVPEGGSTDPFFNGSTFDHSNTFVGAATSLQITHTTTVFWPSATVSDLLYFRIGRVGTAGADTYTQDARLLGVAIQYKESTTEPSAWT